MSDKTKLVSIITSTIGRPGLRRCIESVMRQSYPHIQHFIAVDGPAHHEKARSIVKDYEGVDVLYLPYATKQWGTRIHAALPHLSKGDFLEFLDDDNHLEPEHVETMLRTIGDGPWAYSLRNVTMDGMFVGRDQCESLGYLHPIWNTLSGSPALFKGAPDSKGSRGGDSKGSRQARPQYHIDTGCLFLRRDVALELCWKWAPVEFDHPGYYSNDRIFFNALNAKYPGVPTSQKHTFNYEINSTLLNFIMKGNRFMDKRYEGRMPWQGTTAIRSIGQ
jgi:glycosyltransferase involved in cell wall biosynthesis